MRGLIVSCAATRFGLRQGKNFRPGLRAEKRMKFHNMPQKEKIYCADGG
jgi:hypothetical protein